LIRGDTSTGRMCVTYSTAKPCYSIGHKKSDTTKKCAIFLRFFIVV
jgi:hypothetical protein